MAAYCSFSPDYDDFLVLAFSGSAIGSRLNHSHNWNIRCVGNFVHGQRRGRITRNHQRLRASLLKVVRRTHGISGNGFRRFRTIWKASRVAKINVVGIWNESEQSLEHGEAAKAGVENTDASSAWRHSRATPAVLVPEPSVAHFESRWYHAQIIR